NVILQGITAEDLSKLIAKEIRKVLSDAIPQPEQSEAKDRLMTVQEASDFLQLSVPTIYSKVSRRELPFMKRSKRLYFSEVDLLEYLKAGRQMTVSEIENEAINYLKK